MHKSFLQQVKKQLLNLKWSQMNKFLKWKADFLYLFIYFNWKYSAHNRQSLSSGWEAESLDAFISSTD